MVDAKCVFTSLASYFKFSKKFGPQIKEEIKHMVIIPCTCLVSSVIYDMVCSRRDIVHVVISWLSQYMSDLSKTHWKALKLLLRFFMCTLNVFLKFKRDSSELSGFCNSNYVGDLDARFSTLGIWLL